MSILADHFQIELGQGYMEGIICPTTTDWKQVNMPEFSGDKFPLSPNLPPGLNVNSLSQQDPGFSQLFFTQFCAGFFLLTPKLYTYTKYSKHWPYNVAHTIDCARNVKSWVFPFTFQAYILPHTLNCMCVSLLRFHIWILEQLYYCPKQPALPRNTKV